MSRSQTSKSRLDKGRGGQSVPTPAVTHDIIPGKFTELDWNCALDVDDSEDLISFIIGDTVNLALEDIFAKYLEKQLVPFTVALAKDAMLQIVEWQFLAHDEGEPNIIIDETWTQDVEPNTCVVDAWAQGAIPKRPDTILTPRTPTVEEGVEPIMSPAEEEVRAEESEEAVRTTGTDQAVAATETGVDEISPTETDHLTPLADLSQKSQKKTKRIVKEVPRRAPPPSDTFVAGWSSRSKVAFQPYKGRIQSAGLSNITETLYETELRLQREEMEAMMSVQLADMMGTGDDESEKGFPVPMGGSTTLKLQTGRPPGNKEVVYDDAGNVVSVVKIPAERLPQHLVRVGYRVVDPAVEAANARLEAMKKGRRFADNQDSSPSTMAPGASGGAVTGTKTAGGTTGGHTKKTTKRRPGSPSTLDARPTQTTSKQAEERLADPLPPSVVDSIILAPGVAIKEGERQKRGPKPVDGGADAEKMLKSLRPVKVKSTVGQLNITDIVDPRNVCIKPLGDNKPIPPIATSG